MKILIIGLGSIGQRHLRNLKIIVPKAKIYALRKKFITPTLNNFNKVINKDIKKKYSIEYINNLKDIIKKKIKLDCAFICTPSSQHIGQAIWLIKNNINCFIEKPLGSSLSRINELQSLLKKKKEVITMMGFQMRFNPIIKDLAKIFKNKKIIGRLLYVNIHNGENIEDFHLYEDYKISYAARKELGGGVILSQIHEIDYFLYLFKDYMIIKNYSISSKISNLKINVEDIFSSSFVLKKKKEKVICTMNLNFFERPKKRKINFIGTDGSIEVCLNKQKISIFKGNKKKTINYNINRNKIFIKELKFFISRIRLKKRIDNNLNIYNGIKTLKFALKLKKLSS